MRRLVIVVALVGLLVPVAATEAGARSSTVAITACGQVITTDAVLRADLTCSGDALTVAASDLTVRLAGHAIRSSDGLGVGIRFDGTDACTDDVAIHGGRISGFFAAVEGDAGCANGNRMSAMTLTDNTWGVHLGFDYSFAIDHTTIVGANGIGPFAPFSGGRVQLSHSTIELAGPSGVNLATSVTGGDAVDSSRLDGGTVVGVTNGRMFISNSRLTGVTLMCSDTDVGVSNSRLIGGTVAEAMACGESFTGDRFVGPGHGVAIVISSDFPSSITDSVFTGWDTAVQISQDISAPFSITGNTFRGNGVGVMGCTTGSLCPFSAGTVNDNRFVDNAGTGLVLRAGTWHVGANVAVHNGGLGIDAEGSTLTVIDDGGNIARHNQPPQCVGVVCTP